MQDTAVLAVLASTTTLTSLTISPSTPTCAQACTIALTAVLPCLLDLRELALPGVTTSRAVTPLLHALLQLTSLVSLALQNADLYDSDVELLVQSCPRCASSLRACELPCARRRQPNLAVGCIATPCTHAGSVRTSVMDMHGVMYIHA